MNDIVERLHERIGVAHSHYISPDIRLLMDAIDALKSLRAENERMRKALADIREEFDGEADCEYFPDSPAPRPNRAMRIVVAIDAALTPKGE